MLLERFLPRTEFNSYEDFKENYRVNIPENFNFGFDVVEGITVIQQRQAAYDRRHDAARCKEDP